MIKLGTNRGSRVAQTSLKGFKRDPEKALTCCRKLEFAQGSKVPQFAIQVIQSTIYLGVRVVCGRYAVYGGYWRVCIR